MEPFFEKAQEYVSKYFNRRYEYPTKGIISISGERYILVKASSMSVQFLKHIRTLYPGMKDNQASLAAGKILYDMAHAIGKADAESFHKAMNVTDPIAKLSSGPIHFAYTGWAFVDISEESKPSEDSNFYLLYDHPQSFEADSWIENISASNTKKSLEYCVCFMNSGYSSGWCEVSFGVTLVAEEILCRARGDKYCRFIMAHPNKIADRVKEYKQDHPELFPAVR